VIMTSPELRVAMDARPGPPVQLDLPLETANLLPAELYARLARLSPLTRLGTPTVWEAVATAVIRQVVHRDQAKASFRRVCEMFGEPVLVAGNVRHAFPSKEAVVSVGVQELRGASVGFKARTLCTLARWCLDTREHLDADELRTALLGIRGIGPWTASVAVCDRFSDFTFYPVDDLAVRAHARLRWPHHAWPKHPAEFAEAWRQQTAPYSAQITAFVLADAVLSEP
jgi:DNA-3-methyladenine glycosylase II